MKVHLVGGFTGSGKTTAIAGACRFFEDQNVRISVLKDDNVDYVIGKLPAQDMAIPVVKVTGGCGCCNYNQLDSQISLLKKTVNPSAIFAEYSGTCTNLITSLLKPLEEYRQADIELVNFSTFIDARLLLLYLKGIAMPLNAADKYIWEKHLRESEILVVNKTDLLSDNESETLRALVKNFLDSKEILFQNSLDKDSVNHWIDFISKPRIQPDSIKDQPDDISERGNSGLAWLDEEIEVITTDNTAVARTYEFIKKLSEDIDGKKLPVGYLQFFLSFNGQSSKVSHTTFLSENSLGSLPLEGSNTVDLMVNARVNTTPEDLRGILYNALKQFKEQEGVIIKEKFISYFQP